MGESAGEERAPKVAKSWASLPAGRIRRTREDVVAAAALGGRAARVGRRRGACVGPPPTSPAAKSRPASCGCGCGAVRLRLQNFFFHTTEGEAGPVEGRGRGAGGVCGGE